MDDFRGDLGDDLVYRLRKRAEIRRQIPNRKSVQQGEPDRIADLLEEAAAALAHHKDYLKHALEEEWRSGYRAAIADSRAHDALKKFAEIDHELGLFIDTPQKEKNT